MREDLGETEGLFRAEARVGAERLLDALIRHHPGQAPAVRPKRVKSKNHEAEAALLRSQLSETGQRLKDALKFIAKQRETIRKLSDDTSIDHPKLADISRAVCATYNVTYANLIGDNRHGNYVLPRHIAFYLARVYTTLSVAEIGRKLGGRDHTTILHGARKITERLETGDEILRDDIDLLKVKLDAAVLARKSAVEEREIAA